MAAIFAYNILKFIFMNENCHILIEISLKYIPKGPIHKKVSIGSDNDKPLPEPMVD